MKAVLRRSKASPAELMQASGDLVMDDAGWRALLEGKDLGLTAVEFQLLKVLVAQPGRIFSRDQLMDAMYRDTRVVADRTVDSHIKKLRKKIADVGARSRDHPFRLRRRLQIRDVMRGPHRQKV